MNTTALVRACWIVAAIALWALVGGIVFLTLMTEPASIYPNARTKQLDAKLDKLLWDGTTREQVAAWLTSHGIPLGDAALDGRNAFITVKDGGFLEEAEIRMHLHFDENGT